MLTRLLCLGALAATLSAQPTPLLRSWAEAEKLDATLASHPDDLDTRAQLLRFYVSQHDDRARTLRRQQILWFVEHHPENYTLQTAVIDPTADREGFAQVSAAWQKVLAAPKPIFDAYANAAGFYRAADPARARRIVDEGLKRYPGNTRISERKGTLLADTIAGVKTLNEYGPPATFDEAPAKSREAERDRKLLESSDDVNLLGGAAHALQEMLFTRTFPSASVPETQDLLIRLLTRADQLDPNFNRWKGELAMAYRNFANTAPTRAGKIALLEKGLTLAETPYTRTFLLPELAQQYLEAGDLAKAAKSANAAMTAPAGQAPLTGYNALQANLVLGRVALKQGDADAAARRLVAGATAYTAGQQPVFMRPLMTAYEQVYAASEFGADPIDISAISFFASLRPASGIVHGVYTVRLAVTKAAVGKLSHDRWANLGNDSVVFWSGTLDGTVADRFTLTGTRPFRYDPNAGNLLLDIAILGQPAGSKTTPSSGFFDADDHSSTVISRETFSGDTGGLTAASGLVTGFTVKAIIGPSLGAPKLLSPAEGTVFSHYPRETTVVWSPVPGATAYLVQWDYRDDRGWSGDRSGAFAELRVTDPVGVFHFVGAQPGRWRVWAVDAAGNAGPKSDWREFRYTR